jgi:acyl carrier protein
MEEILITWLKNYTETEVSLDTEFSNLNFDIFDEAVVVDFVQKNFNVNINKRELWFKTVNELCKEIANCSSTHV